MMPNPRLAGRYAKSLIDLIRDQGQLDPVYNDMQFLHSLMVQSPELVRVLRSPVISGDKKEKILEALGHDKLGAVTKSFTKLIIRKNREEHLPEIITAFISQYKELKDIHVVLLTTAVEVSDEVKNSIMNKIKDGLHFSAVELQAKVDPAIIGGFIIEVDGRLVDASIAYDLGVVKKQFASNDFIYKIR